MQVAQANASALSAMGVDINAMGGAGAPAVDVTAAALATAANLSGMAGLDPAARQAAQEDQRLRKVRVLPTTAPLLAIPDNSLLTTGVRRQHPS